MLTIAGSITDLAIFLQKKLTVVCNFQTLLLHLYLLIVLCILDRYFWSGFECRAVRYIQGGFADKL